MTLFLKQQFYCLKIVTIIATISDKDKNTNRSTVSLKQNNTKHSIKCNDKTTSCTIIEHRASVCLFCRTTYKFVVAHLFGPQMTLTNNLKIEQV